MERKQRRTSETSAEGNNRSGQGVSGSAQRFQQWFYRQLRPGDPDKSWLNPEDGETADTTLSPALIDLDFTQDSGWIVDEDASTAERTILYYSEILPAGDTTPALSDTIRIDPSVADKVEETVTIDENGYKTITFTYAYNGYTFQLDAEVHAVQTHNAQEAIKSAWGVDVEVDADGTLRLR